MATNIATAAASKAARIEGSKRFAAVQAVKDHLDPSYKHIGIGSGSTVVHVVDEIASWPREITCKMTFYPTGTQSEQLIEAAGLKLAYIKNLPRGQMLDPSYKHIGIGSGSTVVHVVDEIASWPREITYKMTFYPTGTQSEQLIEAAGLKLAYIKNLPRGQMLDPSYKHISIGSSSARCRHLGTNRFTFHLPLMKRRGVCIPCVTRALTTPDQKCHNQSGIGISSWECAKNGHQKGCIPVPAHIHDTVVAWCSSPFSPSSSSLG